MDLFEFSKATVIDGKSGEMGNFAGYKPFEDPPPAPGEIERIRDETIQRMNSRKGMT